MTVVKRILKLYGFRARVLASCLPNPRDGGRGSIRDASSGVQDTPYRNEEKAVMADARMAEADAAI